MFKTICHNICFSKNMMEAGSQTPWNIMHLVHPIHQYSRMRRTFWIPLNYRERVSLKNNTIATHLKQLSATNKNSKQLNFISIRRVNWPREAPYNITIPIPYSPSPPLFHEKWTKLPWKFDFKIPTRGFIDTSNSGLNTPTTLKERRPRFIKIIHRHSKKLLMHTCPSKDKPSYGLNQGMDSIIELDFLLETQLFLFNHSFQHAACKTNLHKILARINLQRQRHWRKRSSTVLELMVVLAAISTQRTQMEK